VDVKDWRSAPQLAAVLLAAHDADGPGPAPAADTIVVPDYRVDQLPVLRERLDGPYQVLSQHEFTAEVRQAARLAR
jgi:hypothetical protein